MKRVTKAVFVSGHSLRSLNIGFAELAYDEHRLDGIAVMGMFWDREGL